MSNKKKQSRQLKLSALLKVPPTEPFASLHGVTIVADDALKHKFKHWDVLKTGIKKFDAWLKKNHGSSTLEQSWTCTLARASEEAEEKDFCLLATCQLCKSKSKIKGSTKPIKVDLQLLTKGGRRLLYPLQNHVGKRGHQGALGCGRGRGGWARGGEGTRRVYARCCTRRKTHLASPTFQQT